jgi:hypothetical protein
VTFEEYLFARTQALVRLVRLLTGDEHRAEDGTDPGVVHFTTDMLLAGAEHATWRTGRGAESVEFQGPAGQARFVLARTVATLDALQQTLGSSGRPQPPTGVGVNGRPGIAWVDPPLSGGRDLWCVRWQPTDGIWGPTRYLRDDARRR